MKHQLFKGRETVRVVHCDAQGREIAEPFVIREFIFPEVTVVAPREEHIDPETGTVIEQPEQAA